MRDALGTGPWTPAPTSAENHTPVRRFEEKGPEKNYWPQRSNQLRPVWWAEGDLNPHVPKDTGT